MNSIITARRLPRLVRVRYVLVRQTRRDRDTGRDRQGRLPQSSEDMRVACAMIAASHQKMLFERTFNGMHALRAYQVYRHFSVAPPEWGTCLHRSLCSRRPQGGVSVGCGYRLRAALNRRCARRQEPRGDEDSQPCHLPASRSREAPQGRRALHTSATARGTTSRVRRGGSPISPVSGDCQEHLLRPVRETHSERVAPTAEVITTDNLPRLTADCGRGKQFRDCSNFSSHTSEARCARTRRSLLDDQGTGTPRRACGRAPRA